MSENEYVFENPPPPSTDRLLDDILPRIRKWSEDIYEFEEKEYFKIRWVEINQDANNKDVLLHLFFLDDFQYLSSLNGDVIFKGKWQALEDSNGLLLHKLVGNQIAQSELYDLIFLSEEFFILKKHGNQEQKGRAKYLFLGNEELIDGLSHEDIFNLLDESNTNLRTVIAIVLIVLLAIALLAYQFF